jgi:hypothetical protein
MDCLRDYIGITGCETPATKLVINSLPGISLASIDGLTSQEKSTYMDIWNNVQTRAQKRFQSDITRMLMKRYKLKSIKRQMDFGGAIKNDTQVGIEYQGQYFDFGNCKDYLTESNLAKLFIQNVRFYCPINAVGETATVKVIQVYNNSDLVQDVVYSTTVTTTLGWNIVPVELGFPIMNYLLSVSGISEYAKMPVSIEWSNMLSSCMDCSAIVSGATATTQGNNIVVVRGDDTYGVSGEFSIVCSYESVVCNNKELFANPYWYLCGVEMMIERMHSDRLNKWTLDVERAKSLEEYYFSQYQDQSTNLIEGISLDLSDPCIECNATYRMVEMLP